MTLSEPTAKPTDATKADLVDAGIRLFGELGYETASVRALTKAAGVNIAAIKYHFGSKEALFDACVDEVGRTLSELGPGRILPPDDHSVSRLAPIEAAQILQSVIASVLHTSFDPDFADQVRFMHGQVMTEGRGLERFVDAILNRHIGICTALIARAEGLDPTADTTRLRALSTLVQTVSMVRSQKLLYLTLGWHQPADYISDIVDAIYPLTAHKEDHI